MILQLVDVIYSSKIKIQVMKILIQSIGICLILLVGLSITSCGNTDTSKKGTTTSTTPHGENTAYTSAYVCPMHCKDSGSDAEGTCPVCGMDYVKLETHTKDGHQH